MAVFELILCIIAAVVLSSFLSRFIPKVSTPLVQIALGALASQLPFFPRGLLFSPLASPPFPSLFHGLFHVPFHGSFRTASVRHNRTLYWKS